ncbi:hypothetical protein PV703_14625 [Streptomyces sp. ME01-24h]|nr:hypothetical protein [Streptomyces sp. ME19-03-3]MDX3354518.1 hypothetical protein [Streptomyces sp. ME01-24h]
MNQPTGNEHEKTSPLGEQVTEDEAVPPQEEYTSDAEQRGAGERGRDDATKEQEGRG